jgi:hypothetical protein
MAKSFSGSNQSLVNTFQTLSLNTSAANSTLAGILLNEQYKYLLLRFFDNEGQFTMLSIGPQTLTLTTATLASGSTSATLTTIWPTTNITCQQLVVFSDGEQRTVTFTQGSAAITWQSPTTAVQTSASISCIGVQSYPLPANVSKIKNPTITIGQLVYTPYPVNSVQEWTKLNALPYTASYPAYFFVYNKQLNFWPIPSASGEVMTLYCQFNAPDMTYTDWGSTGITVAGGGGTINSMVVGSNAVTGTATAWNSSGTFPLNTDLTFANLYLTVAPPGGDGLPYQIQSFQSDTALTLLKPVVYAPNTSGAKYSIGQYPFLDGNFHDAILYGALRMYFNTIVKDLDKAGTFQQWFDQKLEQMEFYLSTKSVNVDLGDSPIQSNPNLFFQGK